MTFTIEQLEALKEGITPGPWVVKRETPTMQHDYFTIHRQGDHLPRIKGHTYGHGQDPDLIAASPALLDQLIAEKKVHQKLRKRIEERIRWLKEPLCSHMPEGDELDDYLEQWDRQSYEAEMLTDILEGNG